VEILPLWGELLLEILIALKEPELVLFYLLVCASEGLAVPVRLVIHLWNSSHLWIGLVFVLNRATSSCALGGYACKKGLQKAKSCRLAFHRLLSTPAGGILNNEVVFLRLLWVLGRGRRGADVRRGYCITADIDRINGTTGACMSLIEF